MEIHGSCLQVEDVFTIKSSTSLKTVEIKFKVRRGMRNSFNAFLQLGEKFDESTPDGREVTALVNLEVNTVLNKQFVCLFV